ncbi:MAG: aspartate--tRNA ligase [Bacteroidota bacterium]
MYRTHNCGELRIENQNNKVTLSGWVQKIRKLGGMTFVDLRDRYGITQLVFDLENNAELAEAATKLGREFVIKVEGNVVERSSKNPDMETGDIEIIVEKLDIIKASETPPFTIENESDGGEELRMRYRYLDIRRNPVRDALILRHKVSKAVRDYLDENKFIEAETPYLIKSTPEGARDFVVPSRLSAGEFYALPQSPQVFKQLFMVGGLDRYYQIVKCFRDEDFRADRQPEFTQIDCEMSFVTQDDVINMFSGMAKYIFKTIKGIEFEGDFPVMSYEEAMNSYGSDKPDLRFGMKIHQLNSVTQNKGFKVFDDAEYVGGICVDGAANYSRKQLDKLIDFVKKPQIGAKGLVYAKYNEDGTFKSSVDKFYSQEDLSEWAQVFNAKPGDLLLVISGEKSNSLNALNELRLEMGDRLELRKKDDFVPLWVVDFPLLEWDDDSKRFHAMHHPFTSPKKEDLELMKTDPGKVRANAYDFVINGVEVGGGSIRIYDNELQHKMFDLLGFTPEEAEAQFGFLMEAFKYGAPPHGGAAFGLDRWVALLNGSDSIRDVIAFPKNNAGRDIMIDAPAPIDNAQLNDLNLKIIPSK